MADSISNVHLKDRLCHLTNRIYWEVLCTTSHEGKAYITLGGPPDYDEGKAYITLGGPPDYDQVGASSWTSQYRIVLSWDLLSWLSVEDRILCSFTNFITTRELSGPLYISPDIYHTQITHYSLDKNFL